MKEIEITTSAHQVILAIIIRIPSKRISTRAIGIDGKRNRHRSSHRKDQEALIRASSIPQIDKVRARSGAGHRKAEIAEVAAGSPLGDEVILEGSAAGHEGELLVDAGLGPGVDEVLAAVARVAEVGPAAGLQVESAGAATRHRPQRPLLVDACSVPQVD